MNFNSVEFLLFLPVVLGIYGLVHSRERPRDAVLLVASYLFYMSWDWRYAGLILFSTIVDYVVGGRMAVEDEPRKRKILVTTSVTVNLGLLGIFKYLGFFLETTESLLVLLGIGEGITLPAVNLLLPVGISFYTFQSLSYTIDIYRREIPPEPSFTKFALYVSFFPQLVAGPIVRASQFLPQLRRTPPVDADRVRSGLALMFRGLFKKIVIADMLAGLGVDAVFADPSGYSSLSLLLALYGYSFQIYNDFSGYSDVAIGVARMLGFEIPENFRRPYQSRNPRDFWSRWHISLSTWLRDYLYIPLGGNRGTRLRVARNLMLTMLLGGLWHGAALNFVFWGIWHGLLLIVFRRLARNPMDTGLKAWVERALNFHLITFSWLLFRIDSVESLGAYLAGFAGDWGDTVLNPLFVVILGAAALVHFAPKRWADDAEGRLAASPVVVQAAVYAGLILLFAGLSFGAPAFIYFQF